MGGAADTKLAEIEKSKALFSKKDAIVDADTIEAAQKFVEAGGPPFTIIRTLVDSYRGYAQLSNKISDQTFTLLNLDKDTIVLDAIKSCLVKSFDPARLDKLYPATEPLPEWVEVLTDNAYWRKMIYELGENYSQCEFLVRILQRISEKGYQNEITSLNAACMYTHVYYTMLSDAMDKLRGVSNEDLEYSIGDLLDVGGQREFMYLMTQYILRCVRKKYRRASLPLERLGEELEAYVTSRNRGNVLPSRVYLLVNDLPVGSRDRVIQAISMIAEKQRAAVGDVNVLYKAYSIPSADSDSSRPPADLLRDPIIMEPLLQETFEFYGDPRIDGSSITESQASNFIWLIAYASVYSDGLANGALEEELEVTQAVLRDIRTLLNSRMTTTSINKVMPKILEWMDLPIAALVLVAWVGALIKDDQYSFYQSYYRTTEIPLPLVILEEIAHRHPLLQQHVFSIYIDTFQARINMMPELLLALQKMTLDRLLNLLQMGYVIPVLRYVHHQQLKMDESQVVYFINKLLEVIDQPYPSAVVEFMLHIIHCVVHVLVIGESANVSNLERFLAAVKEGNEGQVDGVLSPDYFHLANDLYARVKAGK